MNTKLTTTLWLLVLTSLATPAWPQTAFTLGSTREEVRSVQGTPTDTDHPPALGYEVWSYGLSSVKISTRDGRVVELSNSGQLKALPPRTVAQRAVKYHHSVGDVRLYYDDDKVYTGIFSISDPELGELYGVAQGGLVYFYEKSLRPGDLYAYPNDRGSLTVGTFKGSRSSAWLSDFSSRLTLIDVSGDVSASGTAMRFGKMTVYDLVSTSGNALHGTSLDVGAIGFDDFYSTTGARLSGSRVQVGNFSFGDWWSSEGTSVGGTTQRIGNILFHSYTGSDGRTYSGTTMEIGNFSFTDIIGR